MEGSFLGVHAHFLNKYLVIFESPLYWKLKKFLRSTSSSLTKNCSMSRWLLRLTVKNILAILRLTVNFLFITLQLTYCQKLAQSILRGALGSLRNRKTAKKFDQNRKPHVKPSKPINLHISGHRIKSGLDSGLDWTMDPGLWTLDSNFTFTVISMDKITNNYAHHSAINLVN